MHKWRKSCFSACKLCGCGPRSQMAFQTTAFLCYSTTNIHCQHRCKFVGMLLNWITICCVFRFFFADFILYQKFFNSLHIFCIVICVSTFLQLKIFYFWNYYFDSIATKTSIHLYLSIHKLYLCTMDHSDRCCFYAYSLRSENVVWVTKKKYIEPKSIYI